MGKTKRQRTLDVNISLLVYIWLKWSDNYNKSNNPSLSLAIRKQCTIRYEKLILLRYKVINEINKNFETKI